MSGTRKRGLRSYKPQVPLPGNGKKCSLERHYSGALRQLVGILDHLASQDPERFVWATEPYLASQCRDYRREKRDTKQRVASKRMWQSGGKAMCYRSSLRYGLRIVQYCKAVLRQQGVIGEREQRERLGILRWGFVVKSHDAVARIVEKRCNMETPSAVSSAVPSAVSSAGEVCGNVCGIECGSDGKQPPANQQNAATGAGSVSGFDGGFSDNLLTSNLSEPKAVVHSSKDVEQANDSGSKKAGQMTAFPEASSSSETREECPDCKGKGFIYNDKSLSGSLCLQCLGRGKKAAPEAEIAAREAVAHRAAAA